MNLGIVIRCCRRTGSSKYVSEVTPYFLKQHNVEVFSNNWDPLDPRIKMHKIPTFSSKNFYLCEASFNALATATSKLHKEDVWLAQPTRYFTPDVGYIQFVYGEWAKQKVGYGYPITLGERALYWMERRNVHKVKKLIVMASTLKEELKKNYGVPDEKIRVIYSGVNADEFILKNRKEVRDAKRKELGLDENDIVLLFVGNPFVRKGLEYAIKSLKHIKNRNAKLLVLGKPAPDDPLEKYLPLVKSEGAEGRFIYGGFTKEAFKYFAASDIFLFPTLYEPFGLVVLEAMAAGLTPVVSRLAGSAELIEDGKEGLLLNNPKDEKEIAEKVNFLIENNLYGKLGAAAQKKARQFTWERTANGMMEVFEEAARR